MKFHKVGIVGSGLMGTGIAQICAAHGYKTFVMKATGGDSGAGKLKIEKNLDKDIAKGRLKKEDKDKILANLYFTAHLGDLSECDLVIETIVEDLNAKRELFERLDAAVKSDAVFCSNTSTLCITELHNSISRKDRFVGTHFFNPVSVMKLVEVVPTFSTLSYVTEMIVDFLTHIGKVPVVMRDSTGFIVNRLLVPYLVDAIRVLENGLAKIEDVDTSMQLGAGHPMGPFVLSDFIGLDVVYAMASLLFEEYKEQRHFPPAVLKRMLLSGFLGKKNGMGFYDYSQTPPAPNNWLVQKPGSMAKHKKAEK